mgnify:FL=1
MPRRGFPDNSEVSRNVIVRRLRAVLVSGIAVGLYAVVSHEVLALRLGSYWVLFVAVLALVLLVTGVLFEPRRSRTRLTWAITSPVIGCILASAALQFVFYVTKTTRTPNVSIADWLFVSTVFAYTVTQLWIVSLLLLALSHINHRVLGRGSRAPNGGQE